MIGWLILLILQAPNPCDPILVPPPAPPEWEDRFAGPAVIGWCHNLLRADGTPIAPLSVNFHLIADNVQNTTPLPAVQVQTAPNGYTEFRAPFDILAGQHTYAIFVIVSDGAANFSDSTLWVRGIPQPTGEFPTPVALVVRP